MIKRILVPLDGSALAERAIPVAARIARASAGSMLFLRVVSTASEFGVYMNEPSSLMQEAITEDLNAANDYLSEVSQSQTLAGIEINTGIFTGSAALKIVDIARSQDIDLIVMCSHGESGIRRWVMGSVAHKVVRHSPVPVLVLRDSGEKSAHLYQERSLRVLVTLDGSPLAEMALEPVMQLATQLAVSGRCHLDLLRVIDLPNRYGGWRSLSYIDNKVLEQARQTTEDYMHVVAERVRAGMLNTATVTTSTRIEMDVPAAIIHAAEHGDVGEEEVGGYDLVAMATHGRGTLPRWALGSVTERVLDSTYLPLLVVRPQEMHSYKV